MNLGAHGPPLLAPHLPSALGHPALTPVCFLSAREDQSTLPRPWEPIKRTVFAFLASFSLHIVEKKDEAGLEYPYKAERCLNLNPFGSYLEVQTPAAPRPRFSLGVVRQGSRNLYFERAAEAALGQEAASLRYMLSKEGSPILLPIHLPVRLTEVIG